MLKLLNKYLFKNSGMFQWFLNQCVFALLLNYIACNLLEKFIFMHPYNLTHSYHLISSYNLIHSDNFMYSSGWPASYEEPHDILNRVV